MTGASYLIESGFEGSQTQKKTKILVDCGLYQGSKTYESHNNDPFVFDASDIDAVIVTHAHIDHSGRVPKLFKEGYKGKVYSTPATKDLSAIMLEDSFSLMGHNHRDNKDGHLFGAEDLKNALDNWEGVEYHQQFNIGDFKIRFLDAGHILGSAMVEVVIREAESNADKKIVFSGDLGNPPTPLLRATEKITDANILLVESTYGDKLHGAKSDRKIQLERAVEDAVKSGGVLMIPAFSLERTQELIFEINDLVENGRVPSVPVFLDSPLAIKAIEIYKKYENYYNNEAKDVIETGDQIFKFPLLRFTASTEESKKINSVPPPKVIMAGSGMSTGGRILHHEMRYLPDPNSTLLIVGYQAPGSLGRQLADGARSVNIFGEHIPVNAKVMFLEGYSGHPDYDMLMEFVKNSVDTLEKVFVVQGEPSSSLFLTQRIRDYLGVESYSPQLGELFEV